MTISAAHLRQWTAASIASTGLLMTGMFLGWPSPWVSKLHAGQVPMTLSDAEVSWAVSLLYAGSVLSPLAAGRLMDRYGRRAVLRSCCVLSLASWILLVFSTDVLVLYLARVLAGMWGGVSYCITPVYLSEIAEPTIRGALNTVFILMVYLGIMLEYVVGPRLSYTGMSTLSGAVPVLYYLGMTAIPESPYFFSMRGDKENARGALRWLRCTPDVEGELERICKSVSSDMSNKGRLRDLFNTVGARRALLMVEMAAFLQRMSGSSVIMAYVSSSLPEDGIVTGDQGAQLVCSLWLVFGVLSTLYVDRLGRKPLLAVSCAGCALATGGLTVWFYIHQWSSISTELFENIPFACFAVYSLFFPLGLACVPSIIQGELFPSNLKGLASGTTSIVVALVSFVNNKLYQPLADSCGVYTNYLYFTIASVYGVYFAVYILVETRQKTLCDIQTELSRTPSTSQPNTGP